MTLPHLHISELISEQMLTCEKSVQITTPAYFCSYWMTHPDVPGRNPKPPVTPSFPHPAHPITKVWQPRVQCLLPPALSLTCPSLDGRPNLLLTWWEDDPRPQSYPVSPICPPPYTTTVTAHWTPSSTEVNHWAVKPEIVSDYLQGHPLGFVRLFQRFNSTVIPRIPCSCSQHHAHPCSTLWPAQFLLLSVHLSDAILVQRSPATGQGQPSGKKKRSPLPCLFITLKL